LFSALADNFGSLWPFPQDSAPPSEPFADKTITDTQCKVPEDITFRSRLQTKEGWASCWQAQLSAKKAVVSQLLLQPAQGAGGAGTPAT